MVLGDEVTHADTNEALMSGSGPARELNRSRMAEAALKNEHLTRQRVDRLEAVLWRLDLDEPMTPQYSRVSKMASSLDALEREILVSIRPRLESLMVAHVNLTRLVEAMDNQLSRGFWGRLRWLVMGR
jgi:hypothetical protein